MKFLFIPLVSLAILSFTFKGLNAQEALIEYSDITRKLSNQEFEDIKSFVLEYGDRQTYCMKVGNNPHYSFDGFEVYLHPEVGPNNMGCDPNVSDFNRIVIRDNGLANKDLKPYMQYHTILIVRQGDLLDEQIYLTHPAAGMQEEKVYYINYDDEYDLDSAVKNANTYLKMIKKEIAANKK